MLNDQTTSAAPVAPTPPDESSEATDANAEQHDASAGQIEGLVVLSQSPLTLEGALEQEAIRHEASAPPLTAGHLITQYTGIVGQILGVGLITAAVRHYGAEPGLYSGVGFGGTLLFAVASTLAHRPASSRVLARLGYAGLSLLLGLGLGLLVGGALHFSAFPHTGVVLVPLGVALSTAAFVVRDGRSLLGRSLISAGVTFAGLLVWLSVGLGMAAKKMDPPATPSGNSGAVAGKPDAAAGSDHGATAAADHSAKTAGDDSPAADHTTTTGAAADHGATAGSKPSAAADAEPTAKTADHTAAKAADHGTAAPKADHSAAATDTHAAAKADDTAKEEEEVTADDVLAH